MDWKVASGTPLEKYFKELDKPEISILPNLTYVTLYIQRTVPNVMSILVMNLVYLVPTYFLYISAAFLAVYFAYTSLPSIEYYMILYYRKKACRFMHRLKKCLGLLFEAELFLGRGAQYLERKRRLSLVIDEIGSYLHASLGTPFLQTKRGDASDLRKYLQLLDEIFESSLFKLNFSYTRIICVLLWKMRSFETFLILPEFKYTRFHENEDFEQKVLDEIKKLHEMVIDRCGWERIQFELGKLNDLIDQNLVKRAPAQITDLYVSSSSIDKTVIESEDEDKDEEKITATPEEVIKGSFFGEQRQTFLLELENTLSAALN